VETPSESSNRHTLLLTHPNKIVHLIFLNTVALLKSHLHRVDTRLYMVTPSTCDV
jgi:hypothetical protein